MRGYKYGEPNKRYVPYWRTADGKQVQMVKEFDAQWRLASDKSIKKILANRYSPKMPPKDDTIYGTEVKRVYV